MPNTRKLQLSFGGGEIDPEMYSRVDAAQYQSGLAKVQNWMVDPKGPLKKRPGFQRVGSSYSNSRKSRLIPFTYSVDQSLAIEFSHNAIRFISDGAFVRWTLPLEFQPSGVNTSADTITFDAEHGLVDNEIIHFSRDLDIDLEAPTAPLITETSRLPSGLDGLGHKDWYVIVVSAKTIQVSLDEGPGSAVDLGSGASISGGGGLRAIKQSQVPLDHSQTEGMYSGDSVQAGNFLKFVDPLGGGAVVFPNTTKVGIDPTTLPAIHQQSGVQTELPLFVQRAYYSGVTPPSPYLPWFDIYIALRLEFINVFTPTQAGSNFTAFNTVHEGTLGESSDPNGASVIANYYEKDQLVRFTDIDGSVLFDPNVNPHLSKLRGQVAMAKRDFLETGSTKTSESTILSDNWTVIPQDSGAYEIATTYTEDELFEIGYEQSGDVITLTHPNHPPRELRRYSNTDWRLVDAALTPTISPPDGGPAGVSLGVTPQRGQPYAFGLPSATHGDNVVLFGMAVPFASGDSLYIRSTAPASTTSLPSGYYHVGSTYSEPISGTEQTTGVTLIYSTGGTQVTFDAGTAVMGGFAYYSPSTADTEQKYKVVAVDVNLQESLPSEEVVAENVLAAPGSKNTVIWSDVTGSVTHKVYKEINGIYGLIGSADASPSGQSTFIDDFIGPDLSDTIPFQDEDIAGGFQPRAVANFEQRRCFAGSDSLPRTLFMSRSGTQSSFTYQMPLQASDRVSVQIASREAHTIRHLIGLRDLIILTQQGEWQVTAINSDAIGPDTIAIRPQSYIGSNKVRPVVVNNKIVFCANRGGHVRELGFQLENDGYLTGDLSLRAAHLFDGYELTDLAYSKAPTPRLWLVSSSGKLLSLTYVPEEKVMAWQQHVTDGTFESVCVVPEGNFDNVYVVVKRTDSTGATVRSIERMVAVQAEEREDAVYLDASGSRDGTNTGARTLEIISSGLYKSGDSVSVKSNEAGVFDIGDVDKEIEFTSGTTKYRLRITAYTSATQVEGTLLADFPGDLHSPSTTATWAIAIKSISNLDHLANQSISVLADGVMHSDVTVSATGTITLETAAVKVCAGLKYTCEAQTLPVSLQIEAGGQGRTKTVNKVYLRVDNSSNLSIGSDSSNLVSVGDLSSTSLTTGEFETQIPDSWDQEGQIVIQSTDALPSTILGLTAQISVGD
jgi:hypothetical protein